MFQVSKPQNKPHLRHPTKRREKRFKCQTVVPNALTCFIMPSSFNRKKKPETFQPKKRNFKAVKRN